MTKLEGIKSRQSQGISPTRQEVEWMITELEWAGRQLEKASRQIRQAS